MNMRFPIQDLMSEEACYERLREILHPDGICCPNGHRLPEDQEPHDRRRAPFMKWKCRECGRVYSILSETVWSGTHYDSVTIMLVMRGIVKGTPTTELAAELNLDYGTLLNRRHQVQELALQQTSVPFFR